MDDESTANMGEMMPMFYIGQHEIHRSLPVTAELVHHAQDLGVSFVRILQ